MQNSLTKKLGLTVATIAMAATSMFTTTDAEAVPSFARQTGMTCNSCHFQAFPALNGMGRSFRAGGYTMKGTQSSIEGENLDLPSNLNMAIFWKNYYVSKSGDAVAHLIWEDEIVTFAAGRVAADVGFLFELGLNMESSGTTAAVGSSTTSEGTLFNNAKVHFNVAQAGSVNIAVIPWSTDAAGVNFGMELMNTVGQRSQRPIEKRDAMSPGASLGITQGEATGISIVASDLGSGWSATYAMWGPVHNGGYVNLTGMATHLRVAYFMDLAGFDTGFSYGGSSGTVAASSDSGVTQNYNIAVAGSTIDMQMQGQIAGGDFGFYLQQATVADSTGVAETTTTSTTVAGRGYTEGGGSGLGYLLKYSVTPKIQVHYAGNSHSTGTVSVTKTFTSVGADYMVAENVRLQAFNYGETTTETGVDAITKTYLGWNIGF